MSMEAIVKFYEKMREDETLREETKDIKDQAALIAFAKARGFDFTAGELNAYAAGHMGKDAPLSDEELEKVAGGYYDRDGYLVTVAMYWCDHYIFDGNEYEGAGGTCGACKFWEFGFPVGTCKCEVNKNTYVKPIHQY